jgi:hypothetical protein
MLACQTFRGWALPALGMLMHNRRPAMKRTTLIIAAVTICCVCAAHADMGSIPFEAHVQIFEPKQRAIIAWNGTEEILLLATDLRASAPTKVLEVIPLPAEPTVKEGDLQAFERAVAIINSRQRRRAGGGGFGGGFGAEGEEPEPPAGEVTFHEKIGAHDISVTRVLNSDGFTGWVENYLKKQGVENPEIPGPMKTVVKQYLRAGFIWFVFDVVEVGNKVKTKDAIQYRFKTRSLYYPLKITRTESGKTEIAPAGCAYPA